VRLEDSTLFCGPYGGGIVIVHNALFPLLGLLEHPDTIEGTSWMGDEKELAEVIRTSSSVAADIELRQRRMTVTTDGVCEVQLSETMDIFIPEFDVWMSHQTELSPTPCDSTVE